MGWATKLNDKVAASAFGKWFRLEGCGHVSIEQFRK